MHAWFELPQCGSTITVDVFLDGGRVDDVQACALDQLSASVLGAEVVGRTRAEIETARDGLNAMLKADGATPGEPFGKLEAVPAAKDCNNRHASTLLAWDATLAVIHEAVA